MCSPTVGALVGTPRSSPMSLMGDGNCSAPSASRGWKGSRSWNWGSAASVRGVFTGAIGVLCSPPKAIHSTVVRARKMSRSSACISRLPGAWSAMAAPGQRSNMSSRSTPTQKFFQNSRSDAWNSTYPSADS